MGIGRASSIAIGIVIIAAAVVGFYTSDFLYPEKELDLLRGVGWTYEQDFNALSDGDLNGQDSWGGGSSPENFDVQTSVTSEGAKAVRHTAFGESIIERTITGVTDGEVSVALRKDGTSDGESVVMFNIKEGTTILAGVGINRNGTGNGDDIWFFHGDGAGGNVFTSLGTTPGSTWHTLVINFDCATDQVRAKLDGGAYTDWKPFSNDATATSITVIQLNKANGSTVAVYWDDIKSGAAAPTEIIYQSEFWF